MSDLPWSAIFSIIVYFGELSSNLQRVLQNLNWIPFSRFIYVYAPPPPISLWNQLWNDDSTWKENFYALFGIIIFDLRGGGQDL